MPEAAQSIDGTLRILRTICAALLLSMVAYVWIAEKIAVHPAQAMDRTFSTSIGILVVAIVVGAFVVRAKMIRPALDTLQTKPEDIPSLGRWRAGTILSYALAESTVLFGLVLRTTGATRAQSASYYVVGPLLLLLWWPRRP